MIPRMMRWRISCAVLASVAVFACSYTGRDKVTLKFPEEHGALKNGLRVIVLPDPSTPLVQVDVRYDVGDKEDPPGKGGLAHVVEHMMFQQHPAGPDKPELFKVLFQIGLFTNAFTSMDSTHYQNLVRKEDLETILALEAARMNFGCKTIAEDQFRRELEVVRNEFRLRVGAPDDILEWKLLESTYPAGHPYYRLGIGTDAELTSMTLADACKFMEDYYTPSRATLIIAGNVTTAELQPLIDNYFARIPAREPKPTVQVPALAIKRKRVDLELDVEQTSVNVIWALPAQYSEDDPAAQYMERVVSGLVRQEGDEFDFATSVRTDGLGGQRAPAFAIRVSLRGPGDVDKALDSVFRAAKRAYRAVSEEQTYEEFKDQVALEKAGLLMAMEESLGNRTLLYGDFAQFAPDLGYFGGLLQRIDHLDQGRIRAYVKAALDPDKAVIVVVHPKKGAQKGAALTGKKFAAGQVDNREASFVDASEAHGKLPIPADIPSAQGSKTFTLGNGMKVLLQPSESSIPVMSVRLMFAVGSAHESPAQAGMATFAASNLRPPLADSGIGGEAALSNPLDQVGAETDTQVSPDTTVFSVRGLSIYSEPIIKGLERLIKAGDYSQESLEKIRQYHGYSLKRRSVRAQDHYQHEFAAAVYGPDHPYALTGQPTQKSLGNFGRDSLVNFKNDHYTAKNATLIVTGRFDPGEIEGLIRDNFGSWDGGHEDKPVASAVAPRSAPVVLGVENEEDLSVRIQVAYPAPAGVDGQYAARLILAEMLSARMTVLREKLGSSYGAGARLIRHRGPGAYLIVAPVDGERAGESLVAVRSAVDSLRKGEDFDATFVRARRAVMKGLVSTSGTSGDLAERLLSIVTYGLSDKFFAKLIHQVAAASTMQVKALIEAELRPEVEVVALLGSKAQVEKAYAEAGLKMTKWVPLDEEQK
jgi:zinc protease